VRGRFDTALLVAVLFDNKYGPTTSTMSAMMLRD